MFTDLCSQETSKRSSRFYKIARRRCRLHAGIQALKAAQRQNDYLQLNIDVSKNVGVWGAEGKQWDTETFILESKTQLMAKTTVSALMFT